MKILSSLLFAVFLAIGSMSYSYALLPDDAQKSELKTTIQQLNDAATSKNLAVIADNMPEQLFKEMAKRLNQPEQSLRDSFLQQIEQQLGSLPADAYTLDAEHIEYNETEKGRFYALVPTKVETEKVLLEYYTLALYENNHWHLVFGGQKTVQNPIFLEIYPELEFINVPLAKVTNK